MSKEDGRRKGISLRSCVIDAFRSGQTITMVMQTYGVTYKYAIDIKKTLGQT
jgi:hypothetical protein